MNKGVVRGILLFALIIPVVVCTAAWRTSDSSKGIEPGSTEGKTIVEFWEQDGVEQQIVMDNLIVEFQKKNPAIYVKRVHMETEDLRHNYTSAAIGGGGPDVVLGPNDNLGVFVPGELVVPIADIVGEKYLREFDAVALGSGTYKGVQYLLPDRNGNELILIYNKAFVKSAPKTWDELEKIGAGLVKEGKCTYTLSFNLVEPFWTIPFLAAFDGKVFDDPQGKNPNPTLNTAAMKKTMEFMYGLIVRKIIPKEMDYDTASNLFKEDHVPFTINGPWSFGDYLAGDMNIGVCPIPAINGKYPAPYSAVKGYTVSQTVLKDRTKKAAVKRFIEFMTCKESQLKMTASHGQSPTIKTAMKEKVITGNPLIQGQLEQLAKTVPMPIITQMRAIWDALKPVQQDVFSGKMKPEDAPAKMQKRAEDGIKALGF